MRLAQRIPDFMQHLPRSADGGFARRRGTQATRLALKQRRLIQGLEFLQQLAGRGLTQVQARRRLVDVQGFAQRIQ